MWWVSFCIILQLFYLFYNKNKTKQIKMVWNESESQVEARSCRLYDHSKRLELCNECKEMKNQWRILCSKVAQSNLNYHTISFTTVWERTVEGQKRTAGWGHNCSCPQWRSWWLKQEWWWCRWTKDGGFRIYVRVYLKGLVDRPDVECVREESKINSRFLSF